MEPAWRKTETYLGVRYKQPDTGDMLQRGRGETSAASNAHVGLGSKKNNGHLVKPGGREQACG